MTTSTRATIPRARPQGGPPLLAPALAYGVLMVTSVILTATGPQPSASATAIVSYDSTHHDALVVAGFLSFAAAAPLAIWTATAYRRLRSLGVTAPGVVIGLAGGLLAAGSLALSGLISWTRAEAPPEPAVTKALTDLGFATGAAGFVVPLGLLLAGVGVPALILRLVPRLLAWTGLVIAAFGLLSTFTLLTSALDFTLPIGRFGGLIWLVVISVMLTHDRRTLRATAPAPAGAGLT
jgi:hypothetical protein